MQKLFRPSARVLLKLQSSSHKLSLEMSLQPMLRTVHNLEKILYKCFLFRRVSKLAAKFLLQVLPHSLLRYKYKFHAPIFLSSTGLIIAATPAIKIVKIIVRVPAEISPKKVSAKKLAAKLIITIAPIILSFLAGGIMNAVLPKNIFFTNLGLSFF